MVPMTSLPPFQARLLAARLGAEGILWQLRGETAVYPFAAVEVLVEATRSSTPAPSSTLSGPSDARRRARPRPHRSATGGRRSS